MVLVLKVGVLLTTLGQMLSTESVSHCIVMEMLRVCVCSLSRWRTVACRNDSHCVLMEMLRVCVQRKSVENSSMSE